MKDKFYIKTGIEFNEYYNKTYKKLVNWIYFSIRDNNIAEDIVADAFINILKYIDNFDVTKSSLNTYVYTITKNEMWKYIKYRNSFVSYEVMGEPVYVEDENDEDDIQMKYNLLMNCFSNLPKKYEDILRARVLNGWNYDLISEKFNLPLSSVKNRIKKARQLLIKNYNSKIKLKKLNEIY